MSYIAGEYALALEFERSHNARQQRYLERINQQLKTKIETLELQERLKALDSQRANLENGKESIDASGGKDEEMKHRGTFTAADGTVHTITADSANAFAQKIYNLALTLPATLSPIQGKPVTTVRDYALKWVAMQKTNCQKSGWGNKQEIHLNKHILPLIGDFDIARITNSDIKTAFANLKQDNGQPYSKSYCGSIMATARTMFNQAFEDGIINRNPVPARKRIKNPGVDGKSEEELRLTEDEVVEIFTDILPKIPPEEKQVRMFLAGTVLLGIRRQEWTGLQCKHVDVTGHPPMVHILQKVVYNNDIGNKGDLQPGAKTESGIRSIPIPDIALPYIRDALLPDGESYLVRGNRYNPDGKTWISENAFDYLVEKATNYLPEATRERIKTMSAHKGRRTYTDLGRLAGVNSMVIGANAGHSPQDIHAVTEGIYMHVSEDEKVKGQKKISDYLAEKVSAHT